MCLVFAAVPVVTDGIFQKSGTAPNGLAHGNVRGSGPWQRRAHLWTCKSDGTCDTISSAIASCMSGDSPAHPAINRTRVSEGCREAGNSCCGDGTLRVMQRIRLSEAPHGFVGVVCHHELSVTDAELLRAMGLRPSARVRVCKPGEPCIVQVLAGCGHEGGPGGLSGCSCRIGLSGSLARRVSLETVGTAAVMG